MVYFCNISTIVEADKLYKELAKIHHPDKGGDATVMALINSEYQLILEQIYDKPIVKDDTAPVIKKRRIRLTKQTEDGLKRHGSKLVENIFNAFFENMTDKFIERI